MTADRLTQPANWSSIATHAKRNHPQEAVLTTEIFEMPIPIAPEDIDQLGHVNNVVYLRWVQDLAIAHWQEAASAEDQAKLLWVVLRHEIDYKHPAKPGDELLGRTWVGPASRLSFERRSEIIRASDGQLLAQARTLWCPINAATGRPTQVSAAVRERFSTQFPRNA
jgi:acyl-CoA thioester hydrolase